MGTDVLPRLQRLAYPSWAGLLDEPDHPGAALEDHVNQFVAHGGSPDDVRELVGELLDDETAWSLFMKVAPFITEGALKAVLAHEVGYAIKFGSPSLTEKWRLAWQIAGTRIPLFLQVLPLLNTGLPPLVADACSHPEVFEVATNLAMATMAGIGVSSHQRRPLSESVLSTLLDICVEGERGHYAYLVPLAAALGVDAPVNHELLPDGVMDFQRLAEEVGAFTTNRERLLQKARQSGLPVYPPLSDG